MVKDLIADILFGSARPLVGSSLSDDDLIRIAEEQFSDRDVCIVRQWLLLDPILPEAELAQLEADGFGPTFIYAQHLVHDSLGQLNEGEALVTGYERESDGYLFSTGETLIILAGPGARKYISQPSAQAIRSKMHRQAAGLVAADLDATTRARAVQSSQ